MNPRKLLDGGARRLVVTQEVVKLPRMQEFLDDVEARGLFRVTRAHVVQSAGGVRDESHGHGGTLPAVFRDVTDGVYR